MGPTQNTKNTRSRPDRAEWEREAMESKGLENTMHNMKPRTLGPTGYGESDWELMCFFLLFAFLQSRLFLSLVSFNEMAFR